MAVLAGWGLINHRWLPPGPRRGLRRAWLELTIWFAYIYCRSGFPSAWQRTGALWLFRRGVILIWCRRLAMLSLGLWWYLQNNSSVVQPDLYATCG